MNKVGKILIIVVLAAAVAIVIIAKQKSSSKADASRDEKSEVSGAGKADQTSQGVGALPRLLELGADWCIPCKMMKPILAELKKEYPGKMEVEFINVDQAPDIARQYNVRAIPTQIFFDASGKEVFRHMGFFPKEDILAKWKELGFDMEKQPEQ